jgi:hypothetical protein
MLATCSLSDQNARDLKKLGRLIVALKELRVVDISNNNFSAPKLSAFLAELADKETTMDMDSRENLMDVSSTRILGGILRDCLQQHLTVCRWIRARQQLFSLTVCARMQF